MSYLSHLECSNCGSTYDAEGLIRVCLECGYPLLARYHLDQARGRLDRDEITERRAELWRFRELLPVRDPANIVTLGEGGKPLLKLERLGKQLSLSNLYLKDEGQNPTGSFKALGLSVAVSRGVELGAGEFVIPTAGNAGGALASYAARAGVPAHVYMPQDAPLINILEVQVAGADLHLVSGLINDAGREAAAAADEHGWFDVSTLKEPYRLEGKKIMGYELAVAFDWQLPDVIIYPTGGGTGLVGMWKAFSEMEALGWIDGYRPRMVVVQSSGCAPIVKAFNEGVDEAVPWEEASTLAGGLRVPMAIGSRLILTALVESGGTAVALDDSQFRDAQFRLASTEGIFACLEGAATIAALETLVEQDWIKPEERVVVFNTGTGLKHRLMLV
ncbi:MAG: threonine synthase [Candidatus Promineifilaceae bacterium]